MVASIEDGTVRLAMTGAQPVLHIRLVDFVDLTKRVPTVRQSPSAVPAQLTPDRKTGIAPPSTAPLLDWEGAANSLGISPSFVRRLWNERRISGVKVGRLVRFSDADITEYVERNRIQASR